MILIRTDGNFCKLASKRTRLTRPKDFFVSMKREKRGWRPVGIAQTELVFMRNIVLSPAAGRHHVLAQRSEMNGPTRTRATTATTASTVIRARSSSSIRRSTSRPSAMTCSSTVTALAGRSALSRTTTVRLQRFNSYFKRSQKGDPFLFAQLPSAEISAISLLINPTKMLLLRRKLCKVEKKPCGMRRGEDILRNMQYQLTSQ